MAELGQILKISNIYSIKKLKKANYSNMLRSILMIFMVEVALMHGIVTYVSELSQNLVGMNEKFWAVCYTLHIKGIFIFGDCK